MVFAAAGALAFVLFGAVVGARLLLLWRRSRQLPELLLGGGLFLFSAVSQPLILAAQPVADAYGRGASLMVLTPGLVASIASLTSLYAFTTVVFHRGSRTARRVVWMALGASTASAVALLGSLGGTPPGQPFDPVARAALASFSLVFAAGLAWTAAESLHYYSLMRRRIALGLADPIVTNRLLLWGLGCGATATSTVALTLCAALGMNFSSDPLPVVLISAGGMVCSVSWYLAFMPFSSYRDWILRRAEQRTAT